MTAYTAIACDACGHQVQFVAGAKAAPSHARAHLRKRQRAWHARPKIKGEAQRDICADCWAGGAR